MKKQQIAKFVFALAALMFISACNGNGNGPTDPSCTVNCGPGTSPVYISIPAPVQGQMDQAFLRYHRPADVTVSDSESFVSAFYTRWTDSGNTRGVTCNTSQNLDRDFTTWTATCKKPFEGEEKFPVDTEIWFWVLDFGLPVNTGREILIKGVLIPTKTVPGFSWSVGYCKLRADGTPYW